MDSHPDPVSFEPGNASSRWRVVAVSECGQAHLRIDKACEDFSSWTVLNDEILVAAVADGAGSASHGGLGASTAVLTAQQSVLTDPPPVSVSGDIEDAVMNRHLIMGAVSAFEAVKVESERLGLHVSDLATTLIIVIATRSQIGVFHIGDGAVVIGLKDAETLTLSMPAESEFINETVFLTSWDISQTLPTKIFHGAIEDLAIFSDGLQPVALKRPTNDPFRPFFDPLFKAIGEQPSEVTERQLRSLLLSERIRTRTDDDLTLLIAHSV
jgi:Protein phosphatase 2C